MSEQDIVRIDSELRDHREFMTKVALRLEHTAVLQQAMFDRMDDSKVGLDATREKFEEHLRESAKDVAGWRRLKLQAAAFVIGAVLFSRVVDAIVAPKAAPKIEDIKKAVADAIVQEQGK